MMCAAAVGGLQACRSRGAGGAMAPPCFGITVSPISTRGAYHTPNMHYYLAPPDFHTLLRPWFGGCWLALGSQGPFDGFFIFHIGSYHQGPFQENAQAPPFPFPYCVKETCFEVCII